MPKKKKGRNKSQVVIVDQTAIDPPKEQGKQNVKEEKDLPCRDDEKSIIEAPEASVKSISRGVKDLNVSTQQKGRGRGRNRDHKPTVPGEVPRSNVVPAVSQIGIGGARPKISVNKPPEQNKSSLLESMPEDPSTVVDESPNPAIQPNLIQQQSSQTQVSLTFRNSAAPSRPAPETNTAALTSQELQRNINPSQHTKFVSSMPVVQMSDTELAKSDFESFPLRGGRIGNIGKPIKLRANHFDIKMKMTGFLHHYDVAIHPAKMLPKARNRQIIQSMLMSYSKIFGRECPVYDGRKNIYTKEPLPFDGQKIFEIELNDDGRISRFEVAMKWVNQVSLDGLQEFVNGKIEKNYYSSTQTAINILDMVFHQMPSQSYFGIGRSFFPQPHDGGHVIDGGKVIWHGFSQSVRPQWKHFSVVLNNSTTAFYKEVKLVDFILDVLNIREITRPLRPNDIEKLQAELSGVRVVSTYGPGKRKRVIKKITTRPAKTLSFPLEEDNMPRKECTVADYLWKRYKIQLRYPFLPCIQFGDVNKHQYIPVELCTILPGQKTRKKLNDRQTAQMIKHAALPAYQRKAKIESWIEKRDYDNDPYLKHFGITVSKDMKKVDGRVLPSPTIKYSAGKRNTEPGLQPRNGSWDIGDFHYMKACSIKSWALVSFAERAEEGQLREIISRLENIMKSRGITMGKPSIEIIRRGMDDSCIKNIFYDMKKRMPDLEFVFVIISQFQKGDYDLIKQVTSIELGLITQCMQEKNVPKALGSSQFLRNICHKINSKLGGVNNSVIRLNSGVVKVFSKPVIIMGADVTHPAAGDSYRPSIAAVVGSLDSNPFKFMAEVRVQKHRQEYIEHLQEMTKSILLQFYRETKVKPHKIIFYRDGVSEGQFLEILKNEVLAIRNACTSLDPNYKPGITFLIVQKRHQTRLFCEDKRDAVGRAGNVPPGTCVDTDITHPFNYDYYLCSHEGIMGTSKPAHYFPLWDDNDFSPNELQALTNELCYVYANCTRSVSLPVPASYAHKAAFSARSHLEKVFRNGEASCDKNGYPTSEMENAIRVSEQLRNSMYFI